MCSREAQIRGCPCDYLVVIGQWCTPRPCCRCIQTVGVLFNCDYFAIIAEYWRVAAPSCVICTVCKCVLCCSFGCHSPQPHWTLDTHHRRAAAGVSTAAQRIRCDDDVRCGKFMRSPARTRSRSRRVQLSQSPDAPWFGFDQSVCVCVYFVRGLDSVYKRELIMSDEMNRTKTH